MSVDQSGESTESHLSLDSNLESVERGEAAVMDAARPLGFDEETLLDIGVAVRESLVNAVSHGNRYNANKKVDLKITVTPEQLEIEIGDEGNGFEPERVADPLAAENLMRHSGRGLLMMRAFMDEFVVMPRKPAGTLVRMVRKRQH